MSGSSLLLHVASLFQQIYLNFFGVGINTLREGRGSCKASFLNYRVHKSQTITSLIHWLLWSCFRLFGNQLPHSVFFQTNISTPEVWMIWGQFHLCVETTLSNINLCLFTTKIGAQHLLVVWRRQRRKAGNPITTYIKKLQPLLILLDLTMEDSCGYRHSSSLN